MCASVAAMASSHDLTANAGEVAHARSLADPAGFWGEAAALIDWVTPPESVLDDSAAPLYRWYVGGQLNTCANALDRHVAAGNGDRLALVYDSPITGTARTYTYAQLTDEVARFAGVLRDLGVGRGDRVVIYMPMVPEAIVAMLACARLGIMHSVVFGGFSASALRARVEDAQAKLVITTDGQYRRGSAVSLKAAVDEAVADQPSVRHVLVVRRTGTDVEWT